MFTAGEWGDNKKNEKILLCIFISTFPSLSLSAGSGRTGAYITMSAALKEAEMESIIDIPAIVTLIRQQRMMMIQTLVGEGKKRGEKGRHFFITPSLYYIGSVYVSS